MHADRTNRTVLILFALLLLAAGGFAGAASIGLFGQKTAQSALTDNVVADFIGRNGTWLWPVAAVVAAIIVLLCLRWLVTILFSTDRAGDLVIAAEGAGRATMAHGAVTHAVAEEIEGYPGVASARARLIGDPESPALVVVVTVEDNADIAVVRQRIESEALAHARSALDDPGLSIRLDLAVTTKRAARVT